LNQTGLFNLESNNDNHDSCNLFVTFEVIYLFPQVYFVFL